MFDDLVGSSRVDRRKRQLCLATVASFATGWPAAGAATGVQRLPWPPKRPTPQLLLPRHDGAPWSLAAAKGQAVLLNFWASWCEPCRAEMPALHALARQHQAAGLQVVTVNFRESDAAVRRFEAQTPMSLPILMDADGAAARAFGVRIFPTTVAVARNGRAAFSIVGEADWAADAAQHWVASLLSQ